MPTLTHRRHNKELLDGYVILFAERGNNEGYGPHIWTLETELPRPDEALVQFAMKYYDVDQDEAESLVDPDDIVDSAGAWDDHEFVSELWQAMECNQIPMSPGYRTYDGAVVIDRDEVALKYRYQEEI